MLWLAGSLLVCHDNELSGEKSWSLREIPINGILVKWIQLYQVISPNFNFQVLYTQLQWQNFARATD